MLLMERPQEASLKESQYKDRYIRHFCMVTQQNYNCFSTVEMRFHVDYYLLFMSITILIQRKNMCVSSDRSPLKQASINKCDRR